MMISEGDAMVWLLNELLQERSAHAELEDFVNMLIKIVRSCDDQNLGVIASTALENLIQQLTSKVYNDATLPTFDELGIRVPQTVFFKFGSPVGGGVGGKCT